MNEIRPGDVVRLKSGSPKLVVLEVRGKRLLVGWIAYNTNAPHTMLIPAAAVWR